MSLVFFSFCRDFVSLLLSLLFLSFKGGRQHFWVQAGRFLVQRWVYSAQGKGSLSPERSVPKWERRRGRGSSCPASIPFLFSHPFPIFLLFEPFSFCVSMERTEFPALIQHATGTGRRAGTRGQLLCVRSVFDVLQPAPEKLLENLGVGNVFSYQAPFCWERQFWAGISSPG